MTSIIERCAAGIGTVLAPLGLMAVVTVAAPAVSSADCGAGEWWDPVASVCRPPVVPLGCENGAWWDPVANTCRPPVVPPPPLCDNGWWWDPVGNASPAAADPAGLIAQRRVITAWVPRNRRNCGRCC